MNSRGEDMNEELQDFDLKSDDSGTPPEGGEPGSNRWPLVAVVVAIILILVAVFWFRRDSSEVAPEPEATPAPAVSEPLETGEPEPTLDIGEVPPLVDSDAWLQGIVSQISSHPQLAEWLVTPELIRGFVVVVDNIAEGTSPANHLDMAAPEGKFGVRESEDKIYVDSASYRRFDLLTEVIGSLDTEGTAELYTAIRPLCEQAYQDLGYPGEDFEATLRRAIQRVLAVPVVDGPVELERKVTAYEFADPALEELSPAAKQFLRLGPENLQQVQAKLRALSRAMDLES